EPLGPHDPSRAALPEAERRAKAPALSPPLRPLPSTDSPPAGHRTHTDAAHPLLARPKPPPPHELAPHSPAHLISTQAQPLVLDLPADASIEDSVARLKELHETYREDYSAYYQRHADADSPAMRGADPAIVLVPGVGMFSFGADKQTARVAGEFYVNAIG